MTRTVFVLLFSLLFGWAAAGAQTPQKSDLQQRAEQAEQAGTVATARYTYIRAFEDYANRGLLQQSVECGVKATALYYRENYYKEAFDLLRRIDQVVSAAEQTTEAAKAGQRYLTTKERMQMYMKLRKSGNAMEQLNTMERYAQAANDENVTNDLLYNKAIYYYTFGQNAQGNAVFRQMADKLTATKEYDKVDAVYQTLIENGRKSGSANMVAQSYTSYMAWKDSVSALKHAEVVDSLQQHINANEADIAEKDSSLSSRKALIIGLCILAAILAAVLVVGAAVLLRFIVLTRKQRKTIKLANETNALKAKFISNISAQLDPTLQKLDRRIPEVKALLDFSTHVQTLSQLENSAADAVELEDTQIPAFCESLVEQVSPKVKRGVTLTVNAPKLSARLNREYVSYILLHLLGNAAEYTPEGGKITLDYKKRDAHTLQFLVTDSGPGIDPEKRDDVFKPFLEIRDLTKGDGLGLPICKQMALKMKGDLDIDAAFTKGTRFVLHLHDK